jgi:hypothetical protein
LLPIKAGNNTKHDKPEGQNILSFQPAEERKTTPPFHI